MKYTNIIDSPLKGSGDDLLGVSDYVDALSSFLSSASMPTTIAIQGEWGSGKTSFMNQIKSRLCDDADAPDPAKPFHGVWVNMWEYSMMKSPEDVLVNVIKGLTVSCSRILESRSGKNSEVVSNLKNKALTFLKGASVVLVKATAQAGLNAMGLDGAKGVDTFASVVNGDKKLQDAELDEVRPSEFRDAFSEVIRQCLARDQELRETSKKGFMFFIDDLDRIPPENAVHILELLKNLFEVDNCIFVLAIDYEVVVKGLKAKFGTESQMDERAYRSFFDKIIQMPFSMPVGAYDITGFVEKSVENIGVFSHRELQEQLTISEEKLRVSEILADMVFLSTGTNPRSIKRLLNSLSLIDIMHRIKLKKERERGIKVADMTVADKTMNFGLVCIQVAYPDIYDLLIQESNFPEWDEASALDFRLKPLSADKAEALSALSEFDEIWEQILYRACQKSLYLSNRAIYVSRLLNKICFLCPNAETFPAKMTELLGMSAVTTVSSVDSVAIEANKKGNNSKSSDVNDFFSKVQCRNPAVLERLKWFVNLVTETFGDTVKPRVSSSQLCFWFANKAISSRRFIAVWYIAPTTRDPNEYIEIAPCGGGGTTFLLSDDRYRKKGFASEKDFYLGINFREKWGPDNAKGEILGFRPHEYIKRGIWSKRLWTQIRTKFPEDAMCDSYDSLFVFMTECFFKYGSKIPLPEPFNGIETKSEAE